MRFGLFRRRSPRRDDLWRRAAGVSSSHRCSSKLAPHEARAFQLSHPNGRDRPRCNATPRLRFLLVGDEPLPLDPPVCRMCPDHVGTTSAVLCSARTQRLEVVVPHVRLTRSAKRPRGAQLGDACGQASGRRSCRHDDGRPTLSVVLTHVPSLSSRLWYSSLSNFSGTHPCPCWATTGEAAISSDVPLRTRLSEGDTYLLPIVALCILLLCWRAQDGADFWWRLRLARRSCVQRLHCWLPGPYTKWHNTRAAPL